MDGLQRITFRFGSDMEVRYLPQTPRPQDLVTHEGGLWTVAFVSADAAGVMVICELPRGDGHQVETNAA